MNKRKIHNDYFLKKAKSKINLRKRKNKIPFNKSNSTNRINDLFKEDMNYNIESTKTMESKQINDESISIYNKKSMTINRPKNSHQFNTININKSNSYGRNLENRIKEQNNQPTQLLENKNIYETKLKSIIPEEILPLTIDSLNTNYYTNRSERNIKHISKMENTSYSYRNIKLINKNKDNINRKYEILYGNGKTLELNSYNSDENLYKTKYINLSKKYTKILNENKDANINLIKLKNIIEKQRKEKEYIINLLKIEKNKNNYKENINDKIAEDIINEWKEKAEAYRKDLILSQAMVNSLKSEIVILNKNNSKKREINKSNSKEYFYNIKNETDDLINENNTLKKSLSEKNALISNLLEENYKLNDIIKPLGININDYNINPKNISVKNGKNISLMTEMKNAISQYENKFEYFNDYINNIKNEINSLYENINQIVNDTKFEEGIDNNQDKFILSESFYKEINDIKNQMKNINIDFYNLDYSNDIKCMHNYKKLMKIIIEELNKLILINNNFNLINEKENKSIKDLLNLSKDLIGNNSLKKSLINIFNTNRKINQLYKQKILSEQNNKNLDMMIINQEKELEKKKKILSSDSNIRRTYCTTRNNNSKSQKKLKNENFNKMTDDFNFTNRKHIKKIFFKNNKSSEINKLLTTQKKSSNSKNKYYNENLFV